MRWALLLVSMVGVALLAFVPLRLVLPREGLPFSVLDVEGPIWAGTLRQVQWQGIAFGDVAVRPRLWSLVRGERQVQLQSTQLHLRLVDGAQRGIRNAQGQLLVRQPGGVALIDLALQLQQVDLLFDATGCVQAHGRVSLQVLASGAGELPGLPPLRLSGQPACVDHTAVLTLLPDTALPAGVQAEAQLQLWPDGRWQLQSRVDPAQDAVLGVGLQLLGFAATPERGMVRNDHGQLR
ncbi:type II secretion system protein N [Xanthomonas euvesicatoria pv. euvesicatoria]|uniref:Type II secretion system protein N n=5 Tax=Xanthomonas TaxID=338 RepID=A0AAQ0YZ09_XANPE|nr:MULTISPECIES: type II secretion system protein N [Xanthomonas]AOY68389.1 type II secretion system protein N [Xanthomonas euvesicatoria pv. vesicatoria str. 85-10]APO91831.1 type II secretion system protein N [Xanthomonas euvesicatoria]KHL60537.1 type II secretion system protein N [Xanthomonas euvesicatoria]KLA52239.1 type II secretion system protein N [Xanthomonas euvesicatoria]KLA56440.1 type II secretion system protein N [Xanthomonas euvesicatoria]